MQMFLSSYIIANSPTVRCSARSSPRFAGATPLREHRAAETMFLTEIWTGMQFNQRPSVISSRICVSISETYPGWHPPPTWHHPGACRPGKSSARLTGYKKSLLLPPFITHDQRWLLRWNWYASPARHSPYSIRLPSSCKCTIPIFSGLWPLYVLIRFHTVLRVK